MRYSVIVRFLSLLLAVGITAVAAPPAHAAGQVELSTAALSFGPATPGPSQETKTVDVTNTGDEDVVVGSPRITGADKAYFWASETCGGGGSGSITLIPGEDCTIEVTFGASTVGARAATMSVPNSAGPNLTVALSATTLMPDIDVAAPAPFGATAVGDSTTRTVTVSSTGDLPLEVDGATITGADAGQFSVIGNECALAPTVPASSCDITVRFLPTTSGGKSATLNIQNNAGPAATTLLNGSTGVPVLNVAPGTVSFPSTVVGATAVSPVTVSNTGVGQLEWEGATLSGANANQFELNDTCEFAERIATDPCVVRVLFRPTSGGAKNATLTLAVTGQPDQVLSVSGVAAAATKVMTQAPTSLNFGNQTVATSSAPQPVTVTNTGTSQLVISQDTFSIAPANDYTVDYDCPLPLDPGEECALKVLFRPTATGTRNATLSILSSGAITKTVSLTGVGTTASPITINAGVRQFGNVAVGATSGTISHTVTNPGPGTLTLGTLSVGGPSAAHFSIQSTTCNGAVLNPTQLCSVALRFAPTSVGLKAATIVIPSSASGSPHSIAMNGIANRGFPNPTPAALDFGSFGVDETTASQSVTVTNTGNAAMTVNAVSVTGTDAGDFAIVGSDCNGAILAEDATCTASIRFTPTARGLRSATFRITHNAGADQTVALTGTGLGAVASLDTATLAYGEQPVDATSAPLTAVLSNTGDAGLSIGAASLTGTDAGEFVLSGDSCSNATVAPGDSCLLTVKVAPASRGAKSATLTVPHPGGSAVISLSATGTEAVASVNPASRNYGTQAVGTPTSPGTFTVTNTGLDPLELTELGFGGTDPGSFDLTDSTCHGASLAHNQSCTVSVRFNPTSAGGKSATLQLGHNGGGDTTATLNGIGLAPVATPSTTELDFGDVVMGDTSDAETVTITNTGTANLVVGTTSLTGPDASSFDVTDDDCAGATVIPGSSCDISVTFTAGDAGEASASLSVTHNTTDSPTVIALTGNSTPTSDIKILGIGSLYTGHDHLVTRTVKTTGTLMKYKVGIVNEDTVAHTYKFDLTSSGAAATAQVWATGFPAQALPTDGSGNFVTGSVQPGKTVLFELRVTPTAPGQVTAAVDVDLLSAEGDLIESVSTETNTAAPLNGPSGYELFAGQGSQPLIGGPVSGQTVTSPALNVGQTTTFKLRLKNNSATAKQIGLRLTKTDGCSDSFTVTVKSGTAVITTAAFAGTYLTPSLAAGKYKDIVVSIKRVSAACRAVHLQAESLNSGVTVRTSNLVTNASYNAAVD